MTYRALAACGDPFEPILTLVPQPAEADLHDFADGSLLDPSAFDLFNSTPVRTDLSSGWDLLFAVDPGLGPTLVARGGVLGSDSDAGIQLSSSTFDTLTEAPENNYTGDEPVPISVGDVLVVRSRQSTAISFRCRLFGKIEIVAIEGAPAVATIRYVVNPNCEQRGVEPEA